MTNFFLEPRNLNLFITQRFLSAGLPVPLIKDVINYVDKKKQDYQGSPLERAEHYWRKVLPNGSLLKNRQHPACKVALLIPVYNERIERIHRQLDFLSRQVGVNTTEYEIIYLVNNSPTAIEKDPNIVRNNEFVLNALDKKGETLSNVFVIDCCTPGKKFLIVMSEKPEIF